MTDKEKRDAAVDAFAKAIKMRLDVKAAQGFTGWADTYPSDALAGEIADDACTVERAKRKCVDIGARAMMLHYRSCDFEHLATTDAEEQAPEVMGGEITRQDIDLLYAAILRCDIGEPWAAEDGAVRPLPKSVYDAVKTFDRSHANNIEDCRKALDLCRALYAKCSPEDIFTGYPFFDLPLVAIREVRKEALKHRDGDTFQMHGYTFVMPEALMRANTRIMLEGCEK